MPGAFRLQIITQQGVKFDREVEALRAPAFDGYLGVRPGHAPMIAELVIGQVTVREAQHAEEDFACVGGILEVSPAGAVILADAVEAGSAIDLERARQAEERARSRLKERRSPDIDADRADIALAKALNRIKTASKGL